MPASQAGDAGSNPVVCSHYRDVAQQVQSGGLISHVSGVRISSSQYGDPQSVSPFLFMLNLMSAAVVAGSSSRELRKSSRSERGGCEVIVRTKSPAQRPRDRSVQVRPRDAPPRSKGCGHQEYTARRCGPSGYRPATPFANAEHSGSIVQSVRTPLCHGGDGGSNPP